MKQFITRMLVFLIIPILLFMMAIFLNETVDQGYSLSNKIETVFIGDSHFCYGLHLANETNAQMFSANSQSYKFSYFILKKMLEEHPNHGLKSIFLSYSYHNIFQQANRSNEEAYGKYFHLFSKEQKIEYLQNNIQDKLVFLREAFKTKFLKKNYNIPDYAKLRVMSNNSKLDSLNISRRIAYQFIEHNKLKSIANEELLYLNKIQQISEIHQLDLSLVITPLHPLYKKQLPLLVIKKSDSIFNNFKSIKVLDYSSVDFFTKSSKFFTYDGDHLSKEGAQHFTSFIKKELISFPQNDLNSE